MLREIGPQLADRPDTGRVLEQLEDLLRLDLEHAPCPHLEVGVAGHQVKLTLPSYLHQHTLSRSEGWAARARRGWGRPPVLRAGRYGDRGVRRGTSGGSPAVKHEPVRSRSGALCACRRARHRESGPLSGRVGRLRPTADRHSWPSWSSHRCSHATDRTTPCLCFTVLGGLGMRLWVWSCPCRQISV